MTYLHARAQMILGHIRILIYIRSLRFVMGRKLQECGDLIYDTVLALKVVILFNLEKI